jgi:hypothetical protein
MISLSTRRCLNRLVLLILAAAACGPLRRGPGQAPAHIIFTNESLQQATVYVVGAGLNFRRIGTLFAGQTDTLTVPADVAVRGTLNIVARLLARSDVPQTGPVAIRPGEWYQVRLPINSRLMSFLPAGS